MDNEIVFESQIAYSDASGNMQDISSKPVGAAVRAKTMEAYLDLSGGVLKLLPVGDCCNYAADGSGFACAPWWEPPPR